MITGYIPRWWELSGRCRMPQVKIMQTTENSSRLRMRNFWLDHPLTSGIPVIDLHHIYLMHLMMDLHSSANESKGIPPDLFSRFSVVMDFLSEHFFLEAQLLRQLGYPGAMKHILEHNSFIEQLMQNSRSEGMTKQSVAIHTINELIQWLYRHTVKEDMKYAAFLRTKPEETEALIRKLTDSGDVYISPVQMELYQYITGKEIHIKNHEEDIIKTIRNMWKTYDLSIRIPLIDMQHLWFIYIMLKLEREARSYTEREDRIKAFRQNLNQIHEYADIHFSTEEKIMESAGYPGFKAHNAQHRHFMNRIRSKENLSAIESGDPGVLAETAGFLKNWLFTHVAVQDKSLLWFFKKQKGAVLNVSKELVYSGHASLKRKHLNLYRRVVKGK